MITLQDLIASTRSNTVEAAAPKLSKNSPPEAHFHREMREHHKGCCKECKSEINMLKGGLKDADKDEYRDMRGWKENLDKEMKKYKMHEKYMMHHDKEYKKAMGVK